MSLKGSPVSSKLLMYW